MGLAAVPGQEPGEREPLGRGKHGLNGDEDSGWGHGAPPESALRPGSWASPAIPALTRYPSPPVTRSRNS
jgi:hypothetical protein